jgi:hypothetical protein
MNSDRIKDLPTNTYAPSLKEIKLAETIFGKKSNETKNRYKLLLSIGILFFILSTDYIDNLIQKYINISNHSIYILILIKTLIFLILYYILSIKL